MTTDTTTVQTLAQEAYDAFESFTRDADPETHVYKLKDEARDGWIHDLVREAHGDFFPDDWRYEAIMDAAGFIADCDDPDDGRSEFADGHVDVYNAARVAWLGSSLWRASYCDEAVAEGLVAADADIYDRIGVGQYVESEEVYGLVLQALEERVEAVENAQDRLAYLRGELRGERISYGELAELQDLAEFIPVDDVELREAAGIPEHDESEA